MIKKYSKNGVLFKNMKKIMAIVLSISLLFGTVSVGAVSIEDIIEDRNNNKITFYGHVSDLRGKLMVKVYNKKYGENNTAGFVKLDSVTPADDGSFEFSFAMPDKLNDGTDSTGEYEVVYSDGEIPAKQTFLYMNTDDANGIYTILETENSSNIYAELDGEFAKSAAMTGIDTDAYMKLSEERRRRVCVMFAENRNGKDTVKLFNRCIYSQYISVCDESERVLTVKKLNPQYGSYTFEAMSENDRKKTADYMADRSAETLDEVSKIFGTGAALTELSNARKDDIADILGKNAVLLELNENSAYKTYRNLSASDRQKTNEKFVAALAGRVVSLSELKTILSSALTISEESGSSGGSGGASGGGRTASANTAVKNTAVTDSEKTDSKSKNGEFNDIDNVGWASEAIKSLAARGVVSGMGDGSFAPEKSVTREAFVKMLLLASGKFESGHIGNFEDVDNSQWYGEYVGCAVWLKIINGISDTYFGIGMPVTRQDMAVMLQRAAASGGITLENKRAYNDFSDQTDIADYASEAVKALYSADIINGMGDGSFCPNNQLTRAEAAKVIYEMYMPGKESRTAALRQTVQKDSDFKKNVKFLTATDIISKNDAAFSEKENISFGKFVNMAVTLTQKDLFSGDSLNSMAYAIAQSYGMPVENDSNYPTVRQAAEILVRAAGYAPLTENGNYWDWAVRLGIIDGISQPADEQLTAECAVKMVRNTAECAPAVMKNDGKNGIEVLNDKTLLEEVKSIYRGSGLVTANSVTSLYSPDGLSEGRIEIDNSSYICENSGYGDYLGYRVTYYVREDTDGDILKYAEPRTDNEVTVIDAEDFDAVSDDFRILSFHDENRKRDLKISASPNVIYNGKYCSDYTAGDFNIDSGSIIVIKTSDTSGVDTVIIDSYETVITDRISNDKLKIYNKYSHSGATQEINLDKADYSIVKNGEETAAADLNEWDVLSVAASRSGSTPYYRILVSDTREEAVTESYSADSRTVTSVGYIYDIAACYYNSFNENKGVGQTLRIGEEQIYLIDVFGRVAAVLSDNASTDNYAYIINAWVNEDGDSAAIRYYDVNNQEFAEADIADSVTIGGGRYRCGNISESPVFDADGNCSAQLVKLRTDEKGRIKKIETAAAVTASDQTQFTRTKVSTRWFYENSSFNYEAFLTKNAKILCVPSSGNKENYYVLDRSMYENDQVKSLASAVTAYDIDEFMRTDMLVVSYADTAGNVDLSDSLEIFMIDKVCEAVDEEDEKVRMLCGSVGNYEGMEFFIKNDTLIPDVKPGDALYVRFDKKGKIKNAERIFSLDSILSSQTPYEAAKTTRDTDRNSKTQIVTGWIKDVDLNSGSGENMLILDGDTLLPIRLNVSSSKVIVYDAKTKETHVEDINAIDKEDLAIIRLRYSTVKAIVVIKNIEEAGV